jgi:hypothetical protein
LKKSVTVFRTRGIRVIPPTMMMSVMSSMVMPGEG